MKVRCWLPPRHPHRSRLPLQHARTSKASARLGSAAALPSPGMMEVDAANPWQAPEPFLCQGVLAALLTQLRWGPDVGTLRLLCRGWCDAVGEQLPVLAPRPLVTSGGDAAALVSKFPGLRLLRLQHICTFWAGMPPRQARMLGTCYCSCYA